MKRNLIELIGSTVISLNISEEVEMPSFDSKLSNAETLLGNDANFACKLSGKPAPQVAWLVQFLLYC